MRGEETQLAGIPPPACRQRGTRLHAGNPFANGSTLRDGSVTGFGTWLTGELFSLLSSQSILRHSLATAPISRSLPTTRPSPLGSDRPLAKPGDTQRRRCSGSAPRRCFRTCKPAEAAAALSGLLIGSEIAAARQRFGAGAETVTLVASGPLGSLYAAGAGARRLHRARGRCRRGRARRACSRRHGSAGCSGSSRRCRHDRRSLPAPRARPCRDPARRPPGRGAGGGRRRASRPASRRSRCR